MDSSIWELFETFNRKYFEGKLKYVQLSWSKHMTLCAGKTVYRLRGRKSSCFIKLSQPILSQRPHTDTVNTLLHEMIHAYLHVMQGNKYHDSHGPEFRKHMQRINKAHGAKITIYHNFRKEVDKFRVHVYRCDGPCVTRKPFYGVLRRAITTPPGPSDRWYDRHLRDCGGTFHKIAGPGVSEDGDIGVSGSYRGGFRNSVSKRGTRERYRDKIDRIRRSREDSKCDDMGAAVNSSESRPKHSPLKKIPCRPSSAVPNYSSSKPFSPIKPIRPNLSGSKSTPQPLKPTGSINHIPTLTIPDNSNEKRRVSRVSHSPKPQASTSDMSVASNLNESAVLERIRKKYANPSQSILLSETQATMKRELNQIRDFANEVQSHRGPVHMGYGRGGRDRGMEWKYSTRETKGVKRKAIKRMLRRQYRESSGTPLEVHALVTGNINYEYIPKSNLTLSIHKYLNRYITSVIESKRMRPTAPGNGQNVSLNSGVRQSDQNNRQNTSQVQQSSQISALSRQNVGQNQYSGQIASQNTASGQNAGQNSRPIPQKPPPKGFPLPVYAYVNGKINNSYKQKTPKLNVQKYINKYKDSLERERNREKIRERYNKSSHLQSSSSSQPQRLKNETESTRPMNETVSTAFPNSSTGLPFNIRPSPIAPIVEKYMRRFHEAKELAKLEKQIANARQTQNIGRDSQSSNSSVRGLRTDSHSGRSQLNSQNSESRASQNSELRLPASQSPSKSQECKTETNCPVCGVTVPMLTYDRHVEECFGSEGDVEFLNESLDSVEILEVCEAARNDGDRALGGETGDRLGGNIALGGRGGDTGRGIGGEGGERGGDREIDRNRVGDYEDYDFVEEMDVSDIEEVQDEDYESSDDELDKEWSDSGRGSSINAPIPRHTDTPTSIPTGTPISPSKGVLGDWEAMECPNCGSEILVSEKDFHLQYCVDSDDEDRSLDCIALIHRNKNTKETNNKQEETEKASETASRSGNETRNSRKNTEKISEGRKSRENTVAPSLSNSSESAETDIKEEWVGLKLDDPSLVNCPNCMERVKEGNIQGHIIQCLRMLLEDFHGIDCNWEDDEGSETGSIVD